MRFFYTVLLALLFQNTVAVALDHSHKNWTAQLQTYLNSEGLVNYKAWQKNQTALDAYLKELESVDLATYEKFTANEKKAFLINAYNAFTVKLILKNYPVKSIKKIGGIFSSPWKQEFFSILDGKIKSLDPIEHEWLRKKPELKDYRVHAAVNCASISCPRLAATAFAAEKIDEQMDEAMRLWINDLSRNKLSGDELEISKIFDWFQDDFGSEKDIKDILSKYANEKNAAYITPKKDIDHLSYDWNLNEQ